MRSYRLVSGAIGVGLIVGGTTGAGWFAVKHLLHKSWQQTDLTASTHVTSRPEKKKSGHGALSDPSETLALSAEQDGTLAAWLENCANDPAFKDASPQALQKLTEILDRTPLHAGELFDIAHGFHSSYVAPVASLAFYQAAAAHAHDELSRCANSPVDLSKLLAATMRNREDMKRLLDPMIETNHNSQAINTLCSVYLDFLHYLPKGDKKLAKLGQEEQLQILKCAFMKGQPSVACAFLRLADTELVRWLEEWKGGAAEAREDATSDQLRRLEKIIGQTSLHSPVLFDIADAFHSSFGALQASRTLYVAATLHAHSELATNKDSKAEIANILHAIVRNREDFKHLIWPLLD